MPDRDRTPQEPLRLSRRRLLPLAAGLAGVGGSKTALAASPPLPPELARAVAGIEPYLTEQAAFGDVSRGEPIPHTLSEARRTEVGLTRDTWRLEVLSDPEHPAVLGRELSRAARTAMTFADLLRLGEKHAVRFPKVMTCLNIGCPLGMGIWEGVPLREVLWLAQPRDNVRRVLYHGYHNDDPKQRFRSTLPVSRVLEDPFDLPPVILCYRLNGQWLDPRRGGPVRIVVPEAYGFKNVKWLTHVLVSHRVGANDTYGEWNNDVDSPLKTFAATLNPPQTVKAGAPIPIVGYAQVGLGGLRKVQVWLSKDGQPWPGDDLHFTRAPWIDAHILPPPGTWGGSLPGGIPPATHGFDAAGRPRTWPMRFARAHWAALLPGVPPGEYALRCRSIDEKGHAQPMPRPLPHSGRSEIETIALTVRAD